MLKNCLKLENLEKIEREESDKPKEEPEEDKEEPEEDKEEKPKRKGLMGG